MKKSLTLAAAAMLFASHLFASYWVVLKDGTQYKAKAKPTTQSGRAIIQLESGTTLAVDPSAIDWQKSEEATRLGGGELLAAAPQDTAAPVQQRQSTLGSQIHLKKPEPKKNQTPAPIAPPATPAPTTPVASPAPSGSAITTEVIDKFTRAYENVGIFEHTITPLAAGSLRAELTADSEDKVFNILSATAFLMNHNAGVPGADIRMVELFIKTTNGGSGGRFKMSRNDALALDARQMSHDALADYFVRNVIY